MDDISIVKQQSIQMAALDHVPVGCHNHIVKWPVSWNLWLSCLLDDKSMSCCVLCHWCLGPGKWCSCFFLREASIVLGSMILQMHQRMRSVNLGKQRGHSSIQRCGRWYHSLTCSSATWCCEIVGLDAADGLWLRHMAPHQILDHSLSSQCSSHHQSYTWEIHQKENQQVPTKSEISLPFMSMCPRPFWTLHHHKWASMVLMQKWWRNKQLQSRLQQKAQSVEF